MDFMHGSASSAGSYHRWPTPETVRSLAAEWAWMAPGSTPALSVIVGTYFDCASRRERSIPVSLSAVISDSLASPLEPVEPRYPAAPVKGMEHEGISDARRMAARLYR
jgi:hypothetical protein